MIGLEEVNFKEYLLTTDKQDIAQTINKLIEFVDVIGKEGIKTENILKMLKESSHVCMASSTLLEILEKEANIRDITVEEMPIPIFQTIVTLVFFSSISESLLCKLFIKNKEEEVKEKFEQKNKQIKDLQELLEIVCKEDLKKNETKNKQ